MGIRVVVVHGGGPEISGLLKKIGKESRFVDGLRYTDKETMEVVQQVLCGQVNKDLVATLNRLGGRAVGLCGLDGGLFQARRLDEKYGLVGSITKVSPAPVFDALNSGYIPVVATVAQGTDAETSYNVNADTAAAKLAVSLEAEKLILLTDVRGLLHNPEDESSLIPSLQLSSVPALVREGVISGGMIPKVDCCVESVRGLRPRSPGAEFRQEQPSAQVLPLPHAKRGRSRCRCDGHWRVGLHGAGGGAGRSGQGFRRLPD